MKPKTQNIDMYDIQSQPKKKPIIDKKKGFVVKKYDKCIICKKPTNQFKRCYDCYIKYKHINNNNTKSQTTQKDLLSMYGKDINKNKSD